MSGVKVTLNGAERLSADLAKAATLNHARSVVKKHTADLVQKAQEHAPVDTGFLKRSIRVKEFRDGGLTGVVAPHTDYAAYVELGTRFQSPKPYLRPAHEEVKDPFLKALGRLM